MPPEIEDNCLGKIIGIDSEAVLANTLSRCLAHAAERGASSGVYVLVGTDHCAVSLTAQCFVLEIFTASSVFCLVLVLFFSHLPPLPGS